MEVFEEPETVAANVCDAPVVMVALVLDAVIETVRPPLETMLTFELPQPLRRMVRMIATPASTLRKATDGIADAERRGTDKWQRTKKNGDNIRVLTARNRATGRNT